MKSLELSTPHIIAMVGISGSGKTWFAEQFSKTFGALVLSSQILESLTDNKKQINDAVDKLLDEFLKSKKTIILDGDLAKRVDRIRLIRTARGAGYKVVFVWVQTDPNTASVRWRRAKGGSDDDFQKEMKKFTPLQEIEPHIVISGRHTYATQARTVLRHLTKSRTPQSQGEAQPQISRQPGTGEPRGGGRRPNLGDIGRVRIR